jgi:branched-subunit amino acid aminotransferase/4-amino-4-deoxychorismate lyase
MGRKYFPAKNGNMVLTRSKDKKVISLVNFDRFDERGEYFKVLAWTNKLKMFSPNDHFERLNQGINDYFHEIKDTFDELIELSFVGNSKYVQLVYMEAQKRSLAEQ